MAYRATKVDDQEFRQQFTCHSDLQIVQRLVTSGECAHLPGPAYAELKQRIAARFTIHHSDILVVGSTKLGFSISPTKRWRRFGEESDIDVAIISVSLYRRLWGEVSDLVRSDPTFNWPKRSAFRHYHLLGWLRPDALPASPALDAADKWFEFFRELSSSGDFGPYKVSAGVYYDHKFLESYQEKAVAGCREEMEAS